MVKVFISQPMRGKSEREILNTRRNISERLIDMYKDEVYIMDNYFQYAPIDANRLWFLGKSIQMLSEADVAYFAKDFQDYFGCRAEFACAKEYGEDFGLEVITEEPVYVYGEPVWVYWED